MEISLVLGLIPLLHWNCSRDANGELDSLGVASRALHQCLLMLQGLLVWAHRLPLSCGPKVGTSRISFEAIKHRSSELIGLE